MRPGGTEIEGNTAGSYLYNNVNLFTRNVKTNTESLLFVSMVGGANTNAKKSLCTHLSSTKGKTVS
jgi:hypothetical protein